MRLVPLVLAAALFALPPAACNAQGPRIRRSQEALVRQRIADTWVEVHYRRPVARGRTIYGAVVEWNRVWTPGADTATSISLSTPVTVEGQVLPRGSYSIWMIPDSTGPWTVIFSKANPVFHVPYPGDSQDQVRVRVAATQVAHMEALAWYFPTVDGPDATLVMHWGELAVPLRIHIDQ